jgi:putative transposase
MIDKSEKKLSIRHQCELLSVCRAKLSYCSLKTTKDEALLAEINNVWEETPFYGYRKITHELRRRGYFVNLKKVQRITSANGIYAMTPKRRQNTSQPGGDFKQKFKFLLTNAKIQRVNQVWSTDITYIKMPTGFLYLAAIIDVYSRMVVGWAISTTMETNLCLSALRMALKNGYPEAMNTDQGSQFTSKEWINALKIMDIDISMDGKGRWVDNVYIERVWRTFKQECVFLMDFQNVKEAKHEIAKFIDFYNNKRLHQNLGYHTPNEVYNDGSIVNGFTYAKRTKPELLISDFLV